MFASRTPGGRGSTSASGAVGVAPAEDEGGGDLGAGRLGQGHRVGRRRGERPLDRVDRALEPLALGLDLGVGGDGLGDLLPGRCSAPCWPRRPSSSGAAVRSSAGIARTARSASLSIASFSAWRPAAIGLLQLGHRRLQRLDPLGDRRFGGLEGGLLRRRRRSAGPPSPRRRRRTGGGSSRSSGAASNLWSWQRAQPTVRPRKTEPTVPAISVSSDCRLTFGSTLPPTTSRGPQRPKPVAIRASGSPGRASSPASCRVRNSSYGMSPFSAATTQSRYRQASGRSASSSKPLESA